MGVRPSAAAGEYYPPPQQVVVCLLAFTRYCYYRRCTIFLGQHVIYLISPCIVCKFNQLRILFWQHSSLFMDPHKYCVLLSQKTNTHAQEVQVVQTTVRLSVHAWSFRASSIIRIPDSFRWFLWRAGSLLLVVNSIYYRVQYLLVPYPSCSQWAPSKVMKRIQSQPQIFLGEPTINQTTATERKATVAIHITTMFPSSPAAIFAPTSIPMIPEKNHCCE